jgi:hypothetical protein
LLAICNSSTNVLISSIATNKVENKFNVPHSVQIYHLK